MPRRTRKRLVTVVAAVGIVLVIAVIGAIVLSNTAQESLQPVQGTSKERLPRTVRLHAEDIAHMRATLVRCGGITVTKRECFVTFANGRKAVAIVTLTQFSVVIDSFRDGECR